MGDWRLEKHEESKQGQNEQVMGTKNDKWVLWSKIDETMEAEVWSKCNQVQMEFGTWNPATAQILNLRWILKHIILSKLHMVSKLEKLAI